MNHMQTCTGGAITNFTVPLEDKIKWTWQLTMVGRAVGTVTIRVKAYKSDEWELITGETTINPATRRTLIFTGMVEQIQFDDSANVAAANFSMSITSVR